MIDNMINILCDPLEWFKYATDGIEFSGHVTLETYNGSHFGVVLSSPALDLHWPFLLPYLCCKKNFPRASK